MLHCPLSSPLLVFFIALHSCILVEVTRANLSLWSANYQSLALNHLHCESCSFLMFSLLSALPSESHYPV